MGAARRPAAPHGVASRRAWRVRDVRVDSAALVDQIDVENFPTILIGEGEQPRFFGAITPQPEVLRRLIGAHRSGAGKDARLAPEIGGLLRKLQGEQ